MLYRKMFSVLAALVLVAAGVFSSASYARTGDGKDKPAGAGKVPVEAPMNLAILVQDDLVSRVGSELGVTRDFIRSLPAGSQVMVGYITAGALQLRQPFTPDLNKAAKALRMPIGSTSASAYNPYVEVVEALKHFSSQRGHNGVLLISDGLDISRGFDSNSAGQTLDLERAIREANRQNVAVYSFYAPSVGLTGRSRLAASYGQSSLNRLSDETGGKAYFQGTTGFVTFDSYFDRLRQTLNEQYGRAS
ncbi:MAG: hypothetical protein QOE77_433 [Blastocatellia bacterium]|jgi:hypothetical protein|nr:hypothetical protein [Blastocatellia bacterium]